MEHIDHTQGEAGEAVGVVALAKIHTLGTDLSDKVCKK